MVCGLVLAMVYHSHRVVVTNRYRRDAFVTLSLSIVVNVVCHGLNGARVPSNSCNKMRRAIHSYDGGLMKQLIV